MTAATALKPASDKQTALIKKLFGEKDVPAGMEIPTDSKTASRMIDWLFTQPRKPAPQNAAVTPGIYIAPNGDVIKVQANKAKTNVYAKVAVAFGGERLNLLGDVVKWEWQYAAGLIAHITPAMRMTKEQAEEYSLKYSKCMCCGRQLKAAKSVAAGIGPVCIKYFG